MQKNKALSLSILLILSSCASVQENKGTTAGAGIGAAAGALVGAVIGHQSGQRDKGALIGAVLGGGAGGVIGNRLDKQKKELEKIAETKRTEQGLVTQLKSDILFDTGKSNLKPQAKANISELAAIIKKYPENVLTIKGHTDSVGTEKINMPLSEARAKAVQTQLVIAGVPANTVTAIGMGSNQLIETAKTPSLQAKNRRVEIEIAVDESKIPKK